MSFVHLHCHSYFSMMRGTVSIEGLVHCAVERKMPALALTDVNGLYGWVEFVQACRHEGIRPLCGVDLKAADASAVLLAKTPQGYERICRIASELHLAGEPLFETLTAGEEGKPPVRVPLNPDFSLTGALREDRRGLAVLSRDIPLLDRLARETGPGDLYAELLPDCENLTLIRMARDLGIATVAANDVYWERPGDFETHRLLRAIDGNATLSRVGPLLAAAPRNYFCDEAWLRRKLSYAPEAVDAAGRLAESLFSDWRLGETVFPPFADFKGGEAFFTLRWKCYQGARRRYGNPGAAVVDRLEHELKVIREKGFTHYFLVVDDIVRRAPRTCGRGSVAASLVSYCLGITHVDPIAHNLMFERFLNPKRTDPPDADIDFPWDERDGILDYALQKYGPYRAAMVANHVRLQARAAVREIAKVHGLPEEEMRRMRKLIFHLPRKSLPRHWREILDAAGRVHDFPRHLSVHCGGVVIVPDDLRRHVPLERAAKGVNLIQWEKDQTEDFGLVKIDLLGNRSLAVIRDALGAIERHTGRRIEYADLDPTEDAATQETVKRGDTMGVFYVESPATRQLQQKAGVGDYGHLVIHSSIIRPASHGLINEYVGRLRGKRYDPIHPWLEETLAETYGIMVYQEDVTKTAMAMAGFDPVDGDGLRKALSKKRAGRKLETYRQQFFAGTAERGVDAAAAAKIWDMIMSFAGYSFCKPHSASYALVSFQAAYLRTHYPAEFMAAVISNQGGYYSAYAYVSEARRMGLKILPPDVNESAYHYVGRGRTIRVGLMQIAEVAKASLQAVVAGRASGPYRSLEDFLARTPLALGEVKILIRAGCFDGVSGGCTRPQLLWKLLQRPSAPARDELKIPRTLAPAPWIPRDSDYSETEKLDDEREILGFLISRHPLELHGTELAKRAFVSGDQIGRHVGKRVVMAGCLIADKTVATVRNEPMAFMSFEDHTALYDTVFFPEAYRHSVLELNGRDPFWLFGTVRDDLGAVSLHVQRVEPLVKNDNQI